METHFAQGRLAGTGGISIFLYRAAGTALGAALWCVQCVQVGQQLIHATVGCGVVGQGRARESVRC
jgi:hypothetical protein